MVIVTAIVGTNADLFPSILHLYAKPGDKIADVTYGRGVFWRNVDTPQYQTFFTDLATDGVDMRDLPYVDGEMDMVVIDPPYMYTPKGTAKSSIADCYNVNEAALNTTADVIKLYRQGMIEGHRVLKKNGFMVIKCKDGIESSKQYWSHIDLFNIAMDELGMYAKDLFVLVQRTTPAMRWKHQIHARKNHSYFWVFQKRR